MRRILLLLLLPFVTACQAAPQHPTTWIGGIWWAPMLIRSG